MSSVHHGVGPSRRIHDWGEQRHATWLELFFDLVFVVAVSRLGVLLHDDHSLGGVLTLAGPLVPLWWTGISFSYYADLFDANAPSTGWRTLRPCSARRSSRCSAPWRCCTGRPGAPSRAHASCRVGT